MATMYGRSWGGIGAQLAALIALGGAARPAWAGPCEDIGALLGAGISEEVVLETLKQLQPALTPADFACVRARGASEAALAVLAPLVREANAVGPTQASASPALNPAPVGPAAPPRPDEAALQARALRAELLRMEAAVPDSGVAVGLSAAIGFGAGHFYAQRPKAGVVFLLTQTVASGLYIGALASAEPKPGLAVASGVALGLSRLVELPTAGVAARAARMEWIETAPLAR
jgi:hypothetical protein